MKTSVVFSVYVVVVGKYSLEQKKTYLLGSSPPFLHHPVGIGTRRDSSDGHWWTRSWSFWRSSEGHFFTQVRSNSDDTWPHWISHVSFFTTQFNFLMSTNHDYFATEQLRGSDPFPYRPMTWTTTPGFGSSQGAAMTATTTIAMPHY